MTREEASFILANIDRRVCDDELSEALDMAIEALEQEPTTKNDLVDAISREDALMCLTGKFEIREYEPSELISIFLKRIRALPSVTPQEPKPMVEIDLYSVIKQKYIEREVLDKIRAEIQAIIGERNLDDYDFCSGLIVARKIIDKYKAGSEGNNV